MNTMGKKSNYEVRLDKNLRREMQRRDLTVKELAFECQMSPKTIYNWLSGRPPKNLKSLKEVAVFLSKTVDELLFEALDEDETDGARRIILARVDRKLDEVVARLA